MSADYRSIEVIDELRARLDDDGDLERLLCQSLTAAKDTAREPLDRELFEALRWPTDRPGYLDYLAWFARWRPVQSSDEVWRAPGTEEHQEVYDRLTHFYFLINQPVGESRRIVQDVPWFRDWLVGYAKAWGSFLDTTESFDDDLLQSFLRESPEYRVEDSMVDGRPNAPSGWLTFNQFFARELNPGLRPVASPMDNRVVVSTSDCTFKAMHRITPDSTIPEITVKGTHRFATIPELLDGSEYGDAFANGWYAHWFLGPYSYHRFHSPVSGTLVECRAVPGDVYLDVVLDQGQFSAPDGETNGYEFTQARGIVIVDTAGSPYGDIGLVASVPIGMAQVSSVNLTAVPGTQLLKGDEYGYFLFGGSDTILLFQQKANARIFDTGTNYVHYGEPVAQCYV